MRALALLVLVACSEKKPSENKVPTPTTQLPSTGPTQTIQLPQHPALSADVPASWTLDPACNAYVGSPVNDCSPNSGGTIVDCAPPLTCRHRVGKLEVTVMDRPESLDDRKRSIETILNDDGRRDFKAETLGDGWVITYAGGEYGNTFPVYARRDIGGRSYACTMEATTLERQREGVAICKSLRPAR